MATIATLVVDVIGNTSPLSGSLTKAQGQIGAFGGVATKVFAGTALAIGAVGAVAIKAGSDLIESLNKAEVVFGSASSSVIRFSETTGKSFGIAQSAALDSAAAFGAMAQSAGLSEAASADLSIDLVKLAADMASFNNQDPSEMLERLRSGLAGEAEPLRRFGVFISEARVQTEAYASGIARAGEELTDAQKIQARFNIIMQDTAKQQGDFQRTLGESLPNQLRVLKATLIDVAASAGKDLVPAILALVQSFKDLLPLITPIIGFLADVIKIGAEAVTVLANLLQLKWDALKSGITESAVELEKLITQFDTGKISALELGNQIAQLEEETGHAVTLTDEYTSAIHNAREGQQRARQAAFEYNQMLENQQDETIKTARVTDELSDRQRELRLANLALTDSFFGILDSADQVTAAQRRLNTMQENGKTGTKAWEIAVRDAITAQAGLESAVFSYAQELVDAGKSQKDVENKVRDLGREFGVTGGTLQGLLDKVRAYVDELNAVPRNVTTTLTTRHVSTGGTGGGLTQFQHGGIVTHPTVGLVGEAGPEAVIPLERAGALGGINGDIVLNVDGRELARITRNELNRLAGRNAGSGLRT